MGTTRPVQGDRSWEVRTQGVRAYVYRAGVFTGFSGGDVFEAGELARLLAARGGVVPVSEDWSV